MRVFANIQKCTIAIIALITSFAALAADLPIVGVWKLASSTVIDGATGSLVRPWGDSSRGQMIFTKTGQMSIVITATPIKSWSKLLPKSTEEQAELFKSVMAYAGTYMLEGETLKNRKYILDKRTKFMA